MLTYSVLVVLAVLIIMVLGISVWYFFLRSSPQQPATAETKTQPIVQRFVSKDLKKRAFIVELNEGGYKVVFQVYSEEVVTRGGEIAGWRALHDKPVTNSLASAVEIARGWVHLKG